MMNWRDLMAPPPEMLAPAQNTQNTQNRGARGIIAHSADIADIADRVAAEKVAPVSTPPIQADEGASLPVPPPIPPLQPGWRLVYLDHQWKLAGGYDDPGHGTVEACRWEGGAWSVHLTDGQAIPLSRIRSVAAIDWKGRIMGAWTVREHGYDGQGHSTIEGS